MVLFIHSGEKERYIFLKVLIMDVIVQISLLLLPLDAAAPVGGGVFDGDGAALGGGGKEKGVGCRGRAEHVSQAALEVAPAVGKAVTLGYVPGQGRAKFIPFALGGLGPCQVGAGYGKGAGEQLRQHKEAWRCIDQVPVEGHIRNGAPAGVEADAVLAERSGMG